MTNRQKTNKKYTCSCGREVTFIYHKIAMESSHIGSNIFLIDLFTLLKDFLEEDFLEKLNQIKFKAYHKLVSFDVQSFFTNVPLDKTIQIITDFIYLDDNCSKHKSLPIKKKIFVKLLLLASQELFLHKDKLFHQQDGVTMESPLAPVM